MAVTSREKAQAAEALIRHPDLSPAARRVGLELLNHIDRKTGLAWPSEARMAEALGYDERTIRRGKAELQARGLVTWIRRGTSRKGRTPLYALAWGSLLNIAADIKAKVKTARDAVQNGRTSTSSISKTIAAGTKATMASTRDTAKNSTEADSLFISRSSSCLNNVPRPFVDRTLPPSYLTQCFKISSGKGFWKAPSTPQNQILTDQQLDRKASARIWEALGRLAPAQLAQFIDRPDAEALQNAAIKSERYQPGSGLKTLVDLLKATGPTHMVTA